MKSCPTCNRTYPDDTLAFCLVDGAVLSAPYEPEQTQRIPPTRITNSPATEVLNDSSAPRQSLQSTIHAPTPNVPPLYSANAKPERAKPSRRSLAPWLLIGGAIFLVGIFAVAMLALRFAPDRDLARAEPSPSVTSTVTDQTASACGHTLSSALYDKWIQLGGETGNVGCPTTNESDAPASPQGTTGRWIRFAKGDGSYLIEHRSGEHSGQVFEVSGCNFKLYSDLGGTKSWLGFPVSDGRTTETGARQEFEGGYIVWDRKTYNCEAKKN